MNAAHFHLLLNHVPVITSILSVAVLIWGIYIKNEAVKTVALVGFVIAALSTVVVLESGEGAEEIVEDIAVISHDAIEEHEEAAELSKWLMLLLGVGGIGGLFIVKKQTKGQESTLWTLLAIALVTASSLAYTAYLGGQIRHSEEINATSVSESGEESQNQITHEDDDG